MHPNEVMLRKVYDAVNNGHVDALIDVVDDKMEWHIDGMGPVAGDYKGKAGVLRFFNEFTNLYGPTFRLKVLDVVANDSAGIVLTEEGGKHGNELVYKNVHVYSIKRGKLVAFQQFSDSRYERFWSDLAKSGGGPSETVMSYLGALNEKDYKAARGHLSDDGFLFKGPLATFDKPEKLLELMQHLQPHFKVRKSFIDGDDVCLLYELVAESPPATAFTCAWFHVRGGKIVTIETLFDPRPFVPPGETGK